jgi:ATP-dependent Clp protease ATP-binding subunit ClpA
MNNELLPALHIETFFPRRVRRGLETFLLMLIAALIPAGFFLGQFYGYTYQYWGTALILLGILIKFYLIDGFFYSTYTRAKADHEKSFPLASVLLETKNLDPVAGFARSHFGSLFLARLGISADIMRNQKGTAPLSPLKFSQAKTLNSYFKLLVESSPELTQYMKEQTLSDRDIDGAGEWIETSFDNAIQSDRWWSRQHLGRIPGIGKDWAYGQTFVLERYGRFVNGYGAYDFELYKKEIEDLESVLVKSRSANALLVSDTDAIRLTIIKHLAAMIENGKAYPAIEHKKIFLLNALTLSEHADNQQLFESELLKLLYEAERVGNIIFVIDNFPVFLRSAENVGLDALSLLTPFFRSSNLQCVAFSSNDDYYQKLQSKTEIAEHFELVKVAIKDQRSVIQVVENQANILEYQYGVFFTYPAVEMIADAAQKYFQSDSLSSKAIDIAVGIAPHMAENKQILITKDDVLKFVESKTGIPAAHVDQKEKDKLLNLETLLHERVVGQDEAIIAISQAVRRSRSGLGKTGKPIGTFLFLGPTGVGKTETSKALGDIFFGASVPMVRFDMSEYAGVDALSRLIGDSSTMTPGFLANDVREHPYGLLLLDEFEKASHDVHNLFLQILDEGYFNDVRGKRVNVQNMVIIATSNAGSDIIMSVSPTELSSKRDEILEQIISRGIFRPELLNRFDGVIFFHSLAAAHLKEVTKLMLKDLQSRLKEKGIELVITEDLLTVLMEKGNDPHFGARPMNRAIADLVEEKIAEGLIAGTVKSGDKVSFMKDELGQLSISVI